MSINLFQLNYASFCPLIVLIFSVALVLLYVPHASGDKGIVDSEQVASKGSQDFNFVAAGDFGCSGKANKTITGMKSKNPELVLDLGDHSYRKLADCWFATISPLDTGDKFKITVGEHDIDDNLTKYNEYLTHFNLSESFYSFDYQNVHFLIMSTAKNTAIPYVKGSKQYNFVNEDLSKASHDDRINWIIVSSFRPFYSSNTTHPGSDMLQDTYHKLFEKYHVDIVLQAHNHNYQRTYPLLYNDTRPFTPVITDNSKSNYYKNVKGQIFITVGTAGQDLHNFTSQAQFVKHQFLIRGFLNIDVTDKGSKLIGSFYDNKKLKIKDWFSITKDFS